METRRYIILSILSITVSLQTLFAQSNSNPLFGDPDIPSSDERIRINSNESMMYIHRDLIDGNNDLWKLINSFLSK